MYFMKKEYFLCQFEYGYEGFLYQEILNGNLLRYVDVNGNTLELIAPYGYKIIDINPPALSWMEII